MEIKGRGSCQAPRGGASKGQRGASKGQRAYGNLCSILVGPCSGEPHCWVVHEGGILMDLVHLPPPCSASVCLAFASAHSPTCHAYLLKLGHEGLLPIGVLCWHSRSWKCSMQVFAPRLVLSLPRELLIAIDSSCMLGRWSPWACHYKTIVTNLRRDADDSMLTGKTDPPSAC